MRDLVACCEKEDKKKLMKRLKIMEGQIKGIIQMVDENRYCDDILIQIMALDHALKSFGTEVLRNHLLTCVVEDVKKEKKESIEEVIEIIKRFYM